jgi:DNA-directed RNA polymerase subunit RPC12/RpoP
MKHVCASCEGTLDFGKQVVQMLVGPWYDAITPGFTELFAEWHRECFRGEFPLNPQERPYKCEECSNEVLFGERVSFLIIGEETDAGSTVAEKRGYQIYTVKHIPNCPQNDRQHSPLAST